jgi:hypothetical protein
VVWAAMRRVISPMVIERRTTQCVGADTGPTCAAAGPTDRPLRHFAKPGRSAHTGTNSGAIPLAEARAQAGI